MIKHLNSEKEIDKEKNLKASRRQVTCKGLKIRVTTDFLSETVQVKKG